MTSFNKRVYEMFVRVLVFATTYSQLFSKGTLTGELKDQIEAAVQKLSNHAASQLSGKGSVKRAADDRAKARKVLRDQLESISRIARGMKLTQFWMPRERGDVATVEAGHAFAKHAEPLKQLFIGNHMPEDFIEKLKGAIQNLERSINDQTFSKGTRLAATAAIEQTRSDALAALQRLDPIMENILQNDPPTLAVWNSARRVERFAASKVVESQDATAPSLSVPPVTGTDAGAARA